MRRADDRSTTIAVRKGELRRSILALRRALPETERARRSHLIWERVVALPTYQRAHLILGYMAFDHEVLTGGLLQQAMAAGKQVILPAVQPDRQHLALYLITDLERDLSPGYHGILEPHPQRARAIAPEALDVALVPGVAFDEQGRRLGYGAGFYDRLLARLPRRVLKVGLAFEFQVMPRLPQQPHDISLEAIVTDSRIRWGKPSGEDDEAAVVQVFNVAGGRGEV